ncbi:glycerol-3-phosphate 1-O-acyltransferase PlsY [Geobacter sulfurreducens]|uniref:Glycerol-3-phosphate acyltransferase n=1 Tax=Geobacter sulfurreducens (strain ATCC 51573 / DSM 12127 / PCA) TaxID=243231 RepID=PLSY_GEOSL|nr:glycerol-3-phosphate 1-O-acyltransferase PlsY [Geobacter sulfurreducens]P60926.1 RecName: Full=Glycerol-3-phosphate acyltransferase; AltName: Full=Acyl-PO4 G3P acyltransferase; AltName: Full=Acyl-phosphate--glycerol-3-phosphate acyltransferase; AltName: Full=G3P acyltransferase; Short=GPAT; AltName: Full=Lysophosphatidic acid synthase; Short=LPA synthase [Geobacter sulfurreducens PCA]AAR33838.1 acyl-phosphate--glycerol-3-phosphate acyltransferase [Geobacter sulfurreducens PCA]ADI83359.1 acyl-
MLNELILTAVAYIVGSIPTGLLLARASGVDIRATGSGNIGATNVYRTLGRTVGIATLLGDCLKGLVPVLVARKLGFADPWVAAVGLAAFLGHVYTIFLGFKGGKGVATALGVFLGVSPLSVLGALALFIGIVATTRYISLGSIIAAAAMPLFVAAVERRPLLVGMTLVIAVIVIVKHRENIRRLREGTENRFKA